MHVEGNPTSVTETVVMPAQPATGTVIRIPLGGNGYHAPIAAYEVSGFAVTGDASSGSLQAQINMDPRYTALCSFVTMSIQQGTSADADVSFLMSGSAGFVPTQADQGPVTAVASLVDAGEIRKTWTPTPVIMPGGNNANAHVRVNVLNVDGDVLGLSALFYIFNIRARELTPMGPLLWARGAT